MLRFSVPNVPLKPDEARVTIRFRVLYRKKGKRKWYSFATRNTLAEANAIVLPLWGFKPGEITKRIETVRITEEFLGALESDAHEGPYKADTLAMHQAYIDAVK